MLNSPNGSILLFKVEKKHFRKDVKEGQSGLDNPRLDLLCMDNLPLI